MIENSPSDKIKLGTFADVPQGVRKRMARIRKTDTKPELIVRSLAHRMGYRFRIHRRDLPGTPDLVFPGLRRVIFVHGCFWHQHDCKLGKKRPMTRTDYWHPKLERNIARDIKSREDLQAIGWDVLVIWECETKDPELLERRIRDYLGG